MKGDIKENTKMTISSLQVLLIFTKLHLESKH